MSLRSARKSLFSAHSRFGSLEYDGSPVSLEEMERSIAEGVVERFNAETPVHGTIARLPVGSGTSSR